MPGAVQFEIHADDPVRAVDFYQGVFEWQAQKWDGPVDYWLVTAGEDNEPCINGAIRQRSAPFDGEAVFAFVCTIDVPDLDGYLGRVQSLGGGLAMPKMAIPQVGWLAYCNDTEGNVFGMVQADSSLA